MRQIATLHPLYEQELGSQFIGRLRSVAGIPQVFSKSFRMTCYMDDPRVQSVLAMLHEHGLNQKKAGVPLDRTSQYWLQITREYDDGDVADCQLMQIWPAHQARVRNYLKDGVGAWGVERRSIKAGEEWGRGVAGLPIIASASICATLESTEMLGLTFLPLELLHTERHGGDPRPTPWSRIGVPWRVVDSAITMPRLSPYLQRVNSRTGEVLSREARGVIREPGFDDIELHYLRSELDAMPAFDIARDHESFGAGMLVVGRRFYEFCKARNLKCGFKPVRIDEG